MQCGVDLEIHRIVQKLAKGEDVVRTVGADARPQDLTTETAKPFDEVGSRRGNRFWFWILGAMQILTLALLVLFIMTSRSTDSVIPPKVDAASLYAANLEQMRSLTSLLKDALDLVAEQRREIMDLHNQLNQSKFEHEPKERIREQIRERTGLPNDTVKNPER